MPWLGVCDCEKSVSATKYRMSFRSFIVSGSTVAGIFPRCRVGPDGSWVPRGLHYIAHGVLGVSIPQRQRGGACYSQDRGILSLWGTSGDVALGCNRNRLLYSWLRSGSIFWQFEAFGSNRRLAKIELNPGPPWTMPHNRRYCEYYPTSE